MISLDRTQAPPFQLSQDYSLIQPEVIRISDEVKLFAFRGLQQEAVKLELVFRSGRWFEPKNGVSQFTSQMLSKGTERRNSFMIAEALDSLGAHLEINAGFDVVELSLFSLRKNLLASLAVVIEILNTPTFDESELRLMKEISIQNLKVSNEKTNVVASKEIRKAIFGSRYPYGSSIEEENVNSLTGEDLRQFFKAHYTLHSVFLVGNLTDPEIDQMIRVIPGLGGASSRSDSPVVTPGKSITLPKAGSVQTSIRLGKLCVRKNESAPYFDALMFNHVLGGFFGSRLMKNIREEKGLTYGIYSSMNHFLQESFWVIGAEVNQKNAAQVITEIKKEIKALQEIPIPEDELSVAKNYFIGSWQSENATLFAVAEKWKSIHLWNLSPDYYTRLLNHLQEITSKQIQESANRYFGSDDLLEVSVG